MIKDFDNNILYDKYRDQAGRLVGLALEINLRKYYVYSVYALCCTNSNQSAENEVFLNQLTEQYALRRSQGFTVILAGDLNCIRNTDLDASGGTPRTFIRQKHNGLTEWNPKIIFTTYCVFSNQTHKLKLGSTVSEILVNYFDG
jgi:exonuclease III